MNGIMAYHNGTLDLCFLFCRNFLYFLANITVKLHFGRINLLQIWFQEQLYPISWHAAAVCTAAVEDSVIVSGKK